MLALKVIRHVVQQPVGHTIYLNISVMITRPELDMLEQLKLDTHLVADWPHVNYYSVKFEL